MALTHDELCQIAYQFLKRNGFKVCFHDRFVAVTSTGEQPDAMGFRNFASCLIEAKCSRADLLAAAPQSPGSEPATVPGKWIPVSERIPESNKFVLVSNGVWVGQGLYDDSEHLESDEHWQDEHREFINVLHHPVTHWMPLPDAPQEEKL